MKVLVTGATGFVGRHLCQYLINQGYRVIAIGRQAQFSLSHPALSYYSVRDINQSILSNVEVVVHLAARVHQLNERGMQNLSQYQTANVQSTQKWVKAAIRNKVKRFVYLSTIKVYGEKTEKMPFQAHSPVHIHDAYSLSKWQAEQVLQAQAQSSEMEWVIIRPPLIYGPQVKGNFAKLSRLVSKGIPLPFKGVSNARSLISIYNLCSFIETCLYHPKAYSEIFLVSDNQDVSSAQLMRLLGQAQGRQVQLFSFPQRLLQWLGCLIGKGKEIARLIEPLQIDMQKSCQVLDWQPPYTMEAALKRMYQLKHEEKF